MASSAQDPLDVLQLMVNEVLVQTGKALRASRKDGQGNTAQAHGTLQNKLPETMRTFHSALDDLENDIIRAKSVLLRDLTLLQQQRQPVPVPEAEPPQQPQPIESQSKSPMVIDIDSSSPVHDITMVESKPPKQMAPFPDMGMGIPDVNQVDMLIKDEPMTSAPQVSAPQYNDFKTEITSPAQMAPMPPMEEKSMIDDMLSGGDANAELNFTNMEFTLAPTNNDTQNSTTTQEPSFDLTTFTPADGGDDLLPLDLLPQNLEPAKTTPTPALQQSVPDQLENSIENTEASIDELWGDADEDLDFVFNQVMDSRDDPQPFSVMEHGAFDEQYFGIDNGNNNNSM